MNSLLRPDEQAEVRHMMRRTLEKLQSETVTHGEACGCPLCYRRRKTAKDLEALEPDTAEVHTIMVEKLERRISGQGGGA